MGLTQSVESDVDVQFEILILCKAVLGHFINAIGLEAVRREVDVTNAVVPYKEIDDLRQFPSQCGFAPAEPKIGEWRCVFRKPDDFVPRKIALLVQLIPIEARLARCVAMGCYEENDRVQLSLAAEPPKTRVSLGDTSL